MCNGYVCIPLSHSTESCFLPDPEGSLEPSDRAAGQARAHHLLPHLEMGSMQYDSYMSLPATHWSSFCMPTAFGNQSMHCLLDGASDMRTCITSLKIVFRISALGTSVIHTTRLFLLASRMFQASTLSSGDGRTSRRAMVLTFRVRGLSSGLRD